MPTAIVLSMAPQPRVAFDSNGLRILLEECVADLGYRAHKLHEFAEESSASKWSPNWWISESAQGTTVLRVRPPFRYDGASIPALAQFALGARELYEIAGLFHDWLYRIGAPRGAADEVFRVLARSGSRKVGSVRGGIGYLGLRVGGWVAYRKRAHERAATATS